MGNLHHFYFFLSLAVSKNSVSSQRLKMQLDMGHLIIFKKRKIFIKLIFFVIQSNFIVS